MAAPAPVLTALTPQTAIAGQIITLTGTALISPGRATSAMFGATPAIVICLSQTSCQATVPLGPAPGSAVPVTVTTATGTSNALTFEYA